MRSVATFILRVFTDDQSPELIRGSLQRVKNGETHSFQSVDELLHWIAQTTLPDAPPSDVSDDPISLPGK